MSVSMPVMNPADATMDAAIERLRESKEVYEKQMANRGHEDGVTWAQETADYRELKRLAARWPEIKTTETRDAHGSFEVFCDVIGRDCTWLCVDEFWSGDDEDEKYSHHYWDGFAEGALEVFEKM